MRVRRTVLGIVIALLFAFGTEARAESAQVVDKIVSLNKSAIVALQAGDHDKAKTHLMDAVVLGKENGMGMHAAMARTYLHLGILYTDGLKDKEKALRNFALALKVRPDIEITPALASKTVTATFAEARGDKPGATKAPETKVAAAAPPPAAPGADKKKEEAAAKEREQKAEKEKAAAAAAAEKDKAAAVAAEEKKQQADKDRLQKDLGDKDKRLAEKDKQLADKDKQLADKDKQLAEKDKQLAEAVAREKKEREGRERFEKLNQENAKLIAEAVAREKKEREVREKLEKDRLAAETRDKERKAREEQAQSARQRLAEGPEMPASIPQPLFCPTRDEAVVATEMHVHCVPQGQIKARAIVLFYRASGSSHFDSLTMDRSKKGWWTAAIPAHRVSGKTLQYYVEARGDKDQVAAKNGKADSPNLVMLRASADAITSKPPAEAVAAAAAKPATKVKASAKAARRTPAAQRQRAKVSR